MDSVLSGKPGLSVPAGPVRPVVEFRRGNPFNDYTVFMYSSVVWINYNPKKGIIAHFSSHTVWIEGKNLDVVYRGLRDQTLTSVHVDRKDALGEEGQPLVTLIRITQTSKTQHPFGWPKGDELGPLIKG